MAVVFAVLLLVTYGFAFNGLQSHTVTHSLQNAFGFAPQHTGIALAVLLGVVFIGGIKRIAAVSDLLVPIKTLAYIGVTLYVIASQIEHVPAMLETIVKSAFGLDPAFGGLLGSAIVMGVKRGVFANEAGLGSAPNVAAVAAVRHPAAQGVVQAFSVFLDTFVICTCTALLILLSGFYTPGFEGDGIVLTQNSLAAVVGDWGRVFVSVALSLFVFTCILYNFYLGENSLQFLSRNRLVLIGYRALVLALVVWGSVQDLSTVFAFADITMTCLAFVNLMALALLFKVGLRVMRDYDVQRRAGIKQPVFDSAQFADLDLDREAWPAGQRAEPRRRRTPSRCRAAIAESRAGALPGAAPAPQWCPSSHVRREKARHKDYGCSQSRTSSCSTPAAPSACCRPLRDWPAGGFARMRDHLQSLGDARTCAGASPNCNRRWTAPT